MPDTRINLYVYATDENNTPVYEIIHIGFFPASATKGVIDRLNARGIAFYSDVKRQAGFVDIVTCLMGKNINPDVIAKTETYEPRRI